jgi:hypothetical protein
VNERLNGEGIPRDTLPWALTQRRLVLRARSIDKCLLCCAPNVNEAGICEVCYTLLRPEEQGLAERWLAGVGP